MEGYRNTVIELHAIYSMIISKCTSNVSKNTSQFASKTNWIRLGGVPSGPGAPRDNLSIPRPLWACTLAPWAMRPSQPSQTISNVLLLPNFFGCLGGWPKAQRAPWAPLLGGDTLARRLVGVGMFTLGVPLG